MSSVKLESIHSDRNGNGINKGKFKLIPPSTIFKCYKQRWENFFCNDLESKLDCIVKVDPDNTSNNACGCVPWKLNL